MNDHLSRYAVLALVLSAPSSAAETPATLSLSTAMSWALANAPALKQIEARKEGAELEFTNSKTAFLPSLDFLATQKTGTPNGTSLWSLRLSETLWSNGRNWTTWKTAAANRDALGAEAIEVREQLAADLASQWFAYSRTEALVTIQLDKAQLIESQFDVMKKQFEQGLKTREDFQRIRAQLLRTRAELVTLRTQREQIRVELLALIGLEESAPATLVALKPPLGPNAGWKALLQKSDIQLELNPTLQKVTAQREQAQWAPLQARLNYWPNIQVVSEATQSQAGPFSAALNAGDTSSSSFQWSAGLELTWNLWDWGALKRSIHAADANQNATLERLRQTELNLKSTARKTHLELKRLTEEALLQAEVAAMEEDNFRLVEENYRRGRSSYLDLITALRDRADARARWNASYFATLSTHVEILQLEGRAHAWLLDFEKTF